MLSGIPASHLYFFADPVFSFALNGDKAEKQIRIQTLDAESSEWFIEDQAFLRSYDSAPRPPPPLQQVASLSQSSFVSPVELTDLRFRGRGWGRSRIIRP